LIQGETGVGKEVIARRLHHLSRRRNGPFEVVDLTAIPETLLESELFGYEKGAFTGADRQKPGRIELAQKGTLLLDEIGEIPLSFQVKLLRLLQEKTFVRVGGTRTLNSDFRLIAATNRDLEKEAIAGRFRQDLFYRLNMMPINVPPLRDREEDIVILARHFLTQYAVKHNRAGLHLLPDDIAVLTSYSWPGNVRELKNVMERAVLLSKNKRLDFSLLRVEASAEYPQRHGRAETFSLKDKEIFADIPTMPELERRYMAYILEKTKGKIGGSGGAAAVLGLKRTTFYSKMKKLGFEGNRDRKNRKSDDEQKRKIEG
jgi:transcriptional regulator with GAF, ATPase, and Fis domain